MKDEPIELVRGSGNVFRDFGRPDADAQQLRALLAAAITKRLDAEGITVRNAQERTGVAASEFSRIRNANLSRFTIDRLMNILNLLGAHVDVAVKVKNIKPQSALRPVRQHEPA